MMQIRELNYDSTLLALHFLCSFILAHSPAPLPWPGILTLKRLCNGFDLAEHFGFHT